VRAFSKRHELITAELERLEREEGKPRTGRLVQYVAHATRPPKTHDTPETLYGRWRQEARQRGVDPERLADQVSGRELHQPVANLAVKRAFNQLASPEGLTANTSTFARHDVVVALGGQLAAVRAEELGRLAERFLAERAVSVIAEHAAGERRYTTPELLKTEERLDLAALNQRLAPLGLAASVPLGFNNTYALGMRRAEAERRGVKSVSEIFNYYKKMNYKTQIMGASFRNIDEILELAGCDLLTISPELLAELQASDAPLPRALDAQTARAATIHAVTYQETSFHWALNEDVMATEKLAEGIRAFAADSRKLDAMIEGMK